MGLSGVLLMVCSLSSVVAAVSNPPTLSDCFWVVDLSERNRQHRLIGSVHDLEAPASQVFALLIALRDHVTSLGEGILWGHLEIGISVAFRVVDEAALGPEIEVVQSRFDLMLRCGMMLMGRVP